MNKRSPRAPRMAKPAALVLPAKTLRGTLAVGPSLAVYVGEPFAVRTRGKWAAVVLALLEDGGLRRLELGTTDHVGPIGTGRTKLAVLFLHPRSHFGRIAALHAQPSLESIRPGVVDALTKISLPKDDAESLLRAALAWLDVLGVPEARGLLDEDVQEELAEYDAYVDEEGMPPGCSGFSQDLVSKLDRLGAGTRIGLPWLRNAGALRAVYSGEARAVTETRLGTNAVEAAEGFMRSSLGFGAVWPERVISLVGVTRA